MERNQNLTQYRQNLLIIFHIKKEKNLKSQKGRGRALLLLFPSPPQPYSATPSTSYSLQIFSYLQLHMIACAYFDNCTGEGEGEALKGKDYPTSVKNMLASKNQITFCNLHDLIKLTYSVK